MKFLPIFKVSVVVFLSSLLIACGPAVRTESGDCYYRGKGILQLGATLLDGVGAYAETMLETEYQQNQIALQKLQNKLGAIDTDTLRGEEEILAYNNNVDEHNRLLESITDYQERKQRELKDGLRASFSQQVDESGDCQ